MMKKHFIFTGKPAIRGCAVVALLLNADGYHKKNGEPFRAVDVWRSNSHGELFGVLGAIQAADKILNKVYDKLPPMMEAAIEMALETGEDQDTDESWGTGIGRKCAQEMWQGVP